MTNSPSGPDAWTLVAAAEGTGRAQEAVRLGSVCGRAGGPGRGLGWAVPGKPYAAHRLANRNQAERLSRAGGRVQLRPSRHRRPPGGHRRRRPRRAGLVGRPAGRPPNRLHLPILRARTVVGGRLDSHRALAHPSATPATNWKELP
jgi:hypothetical protein